MSTSFIEKPYDGSLLDFIESSDSLDGVRTIHGLKPKEFVRWEFNNGVQIVGREVGKDFHVENMNSLNPKKGSGEKTLRWLNEKYDMIIPRTIISTARGFWKKMYERGLAVPYSQRMKKRNYLDFNESSGSPNKKTVKRYC